MTTKQAIARIAVAALTLSAAGFAAWQQEEGDDKNEGEENSQLGNEP